jgi:hypothetical protein
MRWGGRLRDGGVEEVGVVVVEESGGVVVAVVVAMRGLGAVAKPKRWAWRRGNLTLRRERVRSYAFWVLAGSPVKKARARGRLRRLARLMKVVFWVGSVRRRRAAISCD